MTLTLKHYDIEIRIEKDHDDVTLTEVFEMVEGLLKAAGYQFVSGTLNVDVEGGDAHV